MQFSGINLYAKDALKSYEFYKGLGLAVKNVGENTADEWWCATFDINGSTLWIWKARPESTQGNNRAAVQLIIGCGGLDNMNAMHADLTAKEYAISAPELQFYGGHEMHLTDPDGNQILFLD